MKTMERIFEIKDLKALEDFLQSQTETRSFFVRLLTTISSVSYTHLDVYKRQLLQFYKYLYGNVLYI